MENKRLPVSTDKSIERFGLMLEGGNENDQFFDPGEVLKTGEEMILVKDRRLLTAEHVVKLVLKKEGENAGQVIYVQQYGEEQKKGGWTMEELPHSIKVPLGSVRYRISVVSLAAGLDIPVEIPPLYEDDDYSDEGPAL